MLEESVTINAAIGIYELIMGEILYIDNSFFKGLFFLAFWTFILLLLGVFINSFFWNWKISVIIVGVLLAIEVICFIGRVIDDQSN